MQQLFTFFFGSIASSQFLPSHVLANISQSGCPPCLANAVDVWSQAAKEPTREFADGHMGGRIRCVAQRVARLLGAIQLVHNRPAMTINRYAGLTRLVHNRIAKALFDTPRAGRRPSASTRLAACLNAQAGRVIGARDARLLAGTKNHWLGWGLLATTSGLALIISGRTFGRGART